MTPAWLLAALSYPAWTRSARDVWWLLALDAQANGLEETEASQGWIALRVGRDVSTVQRALKMLAGPPGQPMIVKGLVGRGHGMLDILARPGGTARYRVVTDFHRWGWPDRDAAALRIANASRPDPTPDPTAAACCDLLRAHLEAHRLRSEDDPIPHPRCAAYLGWIDQFRRLLTRGFDVDDVRLVLAHLAVESDGWLERIRGAQAAQLLVYYWDGLLVRARRAA